MRVPARRIAGATLSTALAAVLVAGGVVLAGAPAQAAAGELVVDTSLDSTTVDGACSLREAVANANANTAIHPDCASSLGRESIYFRLSEPGSIVLDPALGALSVTDPAGLTLDGDSAVTLDGGGATQLLQVAAEAKLTLHEMTLTGASADGTGGGAVLNLGDLTVSDSTLRESAATGSANSGGAIFSAGRLLVARSSFIGNDAERGGAIRAAAGTAAILSSTFYGNSSRASGGAVASSDVTTAVVSSTFAANRAGTAGGALVGPVALYGNVFEGNAATSASLQSCYVVLSGSGHNVADDNSCFLFDTTSLSNTSAGLDPTGPADHGGPTPTIALGVGSPAVDVVPTDATGCSNADQRGYLRPVDGDLDGISTCDAGAYELGASPPDTLPPVVTVPANQTATATSTAGATVTYPAATATDTVDGPITPTCTPASGSTFPIGTTTVTCTATDAAGNTGTGTFTITVNAAPIPTKADLQITLTGPATAAPGATVTYTVKVTNTGAAAATNPTTVLGGAGLTTTTTSPTTGTGTLKIGNTTLTGARWTTATLPTGGTLTYTLTGKVTAKAGQTIALAAGTLATTPDPQLATNLTAIATRIR